MFFESGAQRNAFLKVECNATIFLTRQQYDIYIGLEGEQVDIRL